MTTRLLYLVSHPIQYQAPLLRRIAADADIALQVVFARDGGEFDPGFRVAVKWDIPLRDGYPNRILPGLGGTALANEIAAADVVWMHGWQGPRMWHALSLARRCAVPVLMRGENTLIAMPDGNGPRGAAKRVFLRWVFAHCSAYLTVGKANREYYLAHGIAAERLFDTPYAVDNAFFRRAPPDSGRREEMRRRLGLEPGHPIVLFAGKFIPRKHPLALAEAFRRIDKARARDPYLLYVGDGPERAALENAAAVDPAIRIAGFCNQTELPAIYDLADVFVLASTREPWGLAINEAMNGGCAVIASDQCGAAADLIDPTCGAVVPAGDVSALANALVDVLADPVELEKRQRAAVARVSDWNFDADIAGLKRALAFVMKKSRRA